MFIYRPIKVSGPTHGPLSVIGLLSWKSRKRRVYAQAYNQPTDSRGHLIDDTYIQDGAKKVGPLVKS